MLVSWQQPSRRIDSDHNLANESWNKPLFVDYFTRSCRCQRHSIYDAFTEDYSFAAQVGRKIQLQSKHVVVQGNMCTLETPTNTPPQSRLVLTIAIGKQHTKRNTKEETQRKKHKKKKTQKKSLKKKNWSSVNAPASGDSADARRFLKKKLSSAVGSSCCGVMVVERGRQLVLRSDGRRAQ